MANSLKNPIFKDLLLFPRRKYFYSRRMALAGAISLIFLGWCLVGMADTKTILGLQMFRFISYFLLFIFIVIAPATAGNSIQMEKQNRTLGLLFLTGMTSRSIILGKLVSSLISLISSLLIALPLFLLALSLGGISVEQMLLGIGLLTTTIFMGTGIGLFLGAHLKSERQLFGIGIAISAVFYLVLPILLKIFNDWTVLALLQQYLSIFDCMRRILADFSKLDALGNMAFQLIIGVCFTGLAIHRLRAISEGREKIPTVRKEKSAAPRRKPIKGNPMTWKDQVFVYGGMAHEFRIAAMAMGSGSLTTIIVMLISQARFDEDALIGLIALFVGFAIICMVLLTLFRACRSFNIEKETRSIEVLLTSPLSSREIVLGKYFATLQSGLPWLMIAAVPGVFLLCLGILETASSTDMTSFIFLYAMYAIAIPATYLLLIAIGTYLSMYLKTPLSFTLTIVIMLLWLGCIRSLAMIPFGILMANNFDSGADYFVLLMALRLGIGILCDIGLTLLIFKLMITGFKESALTRLI